MKHFLSQLTLHDCARLLFRFRQTHISVTKVNRVLKLLEVSEVLKAKVDAGSLSPSTAYQVAKCSNEDKRQELVEKALAGELN